MPMWSVGRASSTPDRRLGVTLIEMMVVLAIVSIIAGISFPAVSSGLDSLRLNSALNSIVTFIDRGLSRAERRQQVVEVTISKPGNAISMRASEPGFERKLALPDGITIEKILPELPDESEETNLTRVFLLYPGGTVPPFGVLISNRRHSEKTVQVDPITGVAVIGQP